MPNDRQLSPRRLMFAKEYVRLGVGTTAAKTAGYAENSAYNEANRLLKNDDVLAEIDRIRDKAERADTVSRAYIVAGLQEIAENGQTERVLSELSAHPRKFPIFTVTEAVNPECANTNGG